MSKRRKEPKYVALVARGANGGYYHFPDLPRLTLKAESSHGVESYRLELQHLKDYLDELKAQGLPVPEPTRFER